MRTAIRLALQVGLVASACFGNVAEPTTSASPPAGWTPAMDALVTARLAQGATTTLPTGFSRTGAQPPNTPSMPVWSAEAPPDVPIGPAGCADCLPSDLLENEPICFNGYIDSTNGGCNSTPNVFGAFIACGQTVCGTYGTYLDSAGASFRDTDWYRFTIPVTSDVTWSATGTAITRVFILDAVCPAISRGTIAAAACAPASLTLTALPAGTYYAFVGTDVFTGVPCGSTYRATLTATPCCETTPLPGDIVEGEPDCGPAYIDTFNGGCNSTPPVFSAIQCGQTVAGKYGTFLSATGGSTRDTDFYEFTITTTSDVRWTATGDAVTRVFIFNGACPAVSLGTTSAAACAPATVSLTGLAPGTYYAWVGTDVFTGVPCGSRYRATLETSTCCSSIPPQPGDIREGEPTCGAGYIDSTNGGCNSVPNVFGSVRCGETIAGTFGTFLNAAGVQNRDTDWFTFVVDQPASVTWQAQVETQSFIAIVNDICPTTVIASASSPAPCGTATVTANLAPGTYRAFIATSVFTGVPCGTRYRATLRSSPCGCPSDFNHDGIVDFFDYLDFVQAFSAQAPSSDFNNDGVIDFFDYLDFVQAFSSGC